MMCLQLVRCPAPGVLVCARSVYANCALHSAQGVGERDTVFRV